MGKFSETTWTTVRCRPPESDHIFGKMNPNLAKQRREIILYLNNLSRYIKMVTENITVSFSIQIGVT